MDDRVVVDAVRPEVGEIVFCMKSSDRAFAWEYSSVTDGCDGQLYGCLNAYEDGCCAAIETSVGFWVAVLGWICLALGLLMLFMSAAAYQIVTDFLEDDKEKMEKSGTILRLEFMVFDYLKMGNGKQSF